MVDGGAPGGARGERATGVRTVSIRRSLVRNLVLLIVATSAAILVLTLAASQRAVEELSRTIVNRSAARIDAELRGYFRPVLAELAILSDWGRDGLLDERDPARTFPLVRPVLLRTPQLSAVNLGGPDGHGYLVLELPGAFRTRTVDPAVLRRHGEFALYELDGTPRSTWSEKVAYDPRTRPWYRAALEVPAGEPAFTEPYRFFTTHDVGMTFSTRYRPRGRPEERVLSLDVLLADVSDFTMRLDVSPSGRALVITEDGTVVALPRDPRFADREHRRRKVLSHVSRLEQPALAAAYEAWKRAGGGDRVLAFEARGERWWTGFRAFRFGSGKPLYIEVVVPERDYLARFERQRNLILMVVFVALLAAVGLSLAMARAYSRPLEVLARQADRIRALDLSAIEPLPPSRLREVNALAEAHDRMHAALDSFSRYVPVDVVRELVRRGDVAKLGGASAELSILFTDVKGFTSAAEKLPPDVLTTHVAEYFGEMLGILEDHRATVDKLIGDAIMAFWGAPVGNPSHARDALVAVLACVARLEELGARWEAAGLPTFRTRFGLHTGTVVVGNVGSATRLSYTILGDAVNLASRLEGTNGVYGTTVLCSSAFRDAVGEGFEFRLVDRVAVKGRVEPVAIYEPLGPVGRVAETELALARAYEEALERYAARDFDEALRRLEPLVEAGDAPSRRLHALALELRGATLPSDWDGVTRLTSK